MSIYLTTTSTVTISDLGNRTFTHPIVNYNLTDEYKEEEIRDSADIQTCITYGYIHLYDDNGLTYSNIKSGLSSQLLPITTKGDIYIYGSNPIRLPIGTKGQELSPDTSSLNGIKWVTPASYQSTPSDPSTTTSTTGVMMGINSTITPVKSGKILIIISGDTDNSTNSRGTVIGLRVGTGTPPVNGSSLTGTSYGGLKNFFQNNSVVRSPFTLNSIVSSLTIGNTYWVDISLAAVTSGTARVRNISVSITEL